MTVFSIDRHGNTEVEGAVVIGARHNDGGVTIKPTGTLTAKSVTLSDALNVGGRVTVEEGLVVGNAVHFSNEGRLSIASSAASTDSVVSIEHSSESFDGAVISLKSDSDVASFLRTESHGLTTFDLSTNGSVRMSALKLHSGGIQIDRGGMAIKAGGLSVRGGFTLESGDFNLLDRRLAVGSLTSSLQADEKEATLFDGRVASSYYVGAMLRLSVPSSPREGRHSRPPFQFLSFEKTTDTGNAHADTETNKEVVFEVDGDGFLASSAGASFKGEKGVRVATPLHIDNDVFLAAQTIPARWNEATEEWLGDIPLTSSANYLTIKKSSSTTTTVTSTKKGIRLRFNEDKALDDETRQRQMGRILVLSNADDTTTSGVLVIPPHTTIIIVFNGVTWQDVEALRAPMQVLTNVERLEAKNDLVIGNVSFSAGRLQATSLSPGSVLFVNKQHYLSEHRQKFFYSKGTLHAPSLKIDKLAGSLDAQGHDISNLLLSNPKIVNGVIQASELTLSSAVGGAGGGGGLAYFTQRGQLLASKSLALDEDNHLLIKRLYSDIEGNGHALSDVILKGGNLQEIVSAEVEHLRLTSTKINLPSPPSSTALNGEDGTPGKSFSQVIEESLTHGALIGVDSRAGGDLVPLPTQALKFDFDSSVLSLDTVAINRLHSSLDANGQTIRNARISSSTFTDIRSLSVRDLVIESFTSEAEGSRLVYADHQGRLQAYSTSQSEIDIPNLRVTNLQFATSSISLHDKILEHAKLNASTVEFVGSAPRMVVQSLVIENNQVKNQKQRVSRDSGRDRHFLFSSSSGEVAIIPGISLSEDDRAIDFSDYSFKAKEIDANSIRISSTGLSTIESSENANTVSPPLGIERSSGKFVYLTSSSLKDLSIRSNLVIQSGATVIFETDSSDDGAADSASASGLLAIDRNGRVVKISTSSSSDGDAVEGERSDVAEDPKINARFHHLHTSAIVTDQSIKTNRLSAREISLAPLPASSPISPGGNPLIVQDVRSGKLEPEAKIYVSPEDHSLHVNAIYPATASQSDRLRIHSALIEGSELRHSSVSDATSIVTNELTVKQVASFQSPVTILSSLAVYGTVSGAGPYIDTSDRRFKQNIRPVTHALDLIEQLQAVRYELFMVYTLM